MNTPELEHLVELAKLDVARPIQFPLVDVTKLNLTGRGLHSLPDGFQDAFPNLSILFLSNNHFEEIPEIIGRCPKLQMVAFKSNGVKTIHPEALQPQLRWLILTDNQIAEIPETIQRCTKLRKCMLSGNQLQSIPAAMKACTNLELIRLASNRLSEPPMVLLQLPKLAWIALSDNPFLHSILASHAGSRLTILNDLDESDEARILGQGASGTTRERTYQGQPVAVKTYNTTITVTSDGLPEEERRINCAVAGLQQCPAFIRILGQTQTGSLVMELLHDFRAIADPPSFDSCSRDVYTEDCLGRQLTRHQAESMVTALLLALAELHRKGICHGDFYGHNILICSNDVSQVRLSDFGAAFFYEKRSEESSLSYGALLERIELRAFAIFVEEVNSLLSDGRLESLTTLVARCRKEEPLDGNNFESVFVWWKQQQLAGMAEAFGVGLDVAADHESKEDL